MYATYTLNKNEITPQFIEGILNVFDSNKVRLTIEKYDETEYLLSSPNDRTKLLESIKNVENNVNLIELPYEELEKSARIA